jgi:hypothetical protein
MVQTRRPWRVLGRLARQDGVAPQEAALDGVPPDAAAACGGLPRLAVAHQGGGGLAPAHHMRRRGHACPREAPSCRLGDALWPHRDQRAQRGGALGAGGGRRGGTDGAARLGLGARGCRAGEQARVGDPPSRVGLPAARPRPAMRRFSWRLARRGRARKAPRASDGDRGPTRLAGGSVRLRRRPPSSRHVSSLGGWLGVPPPARQDAAGGHAGSAGPGPGRQWEQSGPRSRGVSSGPAPPSPGRTGATPSSR